MEEPKNDGWICVARDGKLYEIGISKDKTQFWLSNERSEGMTFWPEEFFKILDDYFRENF